MAVFVPVSFMGGTAGTFYRQFGMTMAIAIGLSALNALYNYRVYNYYIYMCSYIKMLTFYYTHFRRSLKV